MTLLAAAAAGFIALPARANDITAEWSSVKPPPVPELKPATIDPKTTALLALDFMKGNCGVRPRCASTIPVANKLIEEAHAHDMLVIYTLVGETPKPEGMADGITKPRDGEWIARGGADKFINSDIEQRLKAKGITTVIVMGTSAQGAVVGTTNGAVQRGFKAVVPVDGMSAEDPYNEQYAAWHLYKGGPVYLPKNVILTRSDMIKFGN
ncbi:MAG TPA: isochorismatase family protein [Xanthobacteraceae bacterium]|nr:isochorismatase family protein [Xanthobacteraceae bacterium]